VLGTEEELARHSSSSLERRHVRVARQSHELATERVFNEPFDCGTRRLLASCSIASLVYRLRASG